ncbi:MAG: FimB/Mfa2 family fimbrial subunit [Muribaculaceae bacterium]|nr:FimB/Mfa2 family fimbrial subunit [Muribaculaceae bacterium]
MKLFSLPNKKNFLQKKLLGIILLLISGIVASCSDENDSKAINENLPGSRSDVEVSLSWIRTMEGRQYICDELTGGINFEGNTEPVSLDYTPMIAGLTVQIFNRDNLSQSNIPVENIFIEKEFVSENSDWNFNVTLPPGQYSAIAWISLREAEGNYFYDFESLNSVTLTGDKNSITSMRDCFRGECNFEVKSEAARIDIEMKRPTGKFSIITNDLDKFLQKQGDDLSLFEVEVSYAWFFPTSYNALSDRLSNSSTGEKFKCKILPLSESRALIASDYMLMNPGESGLTAVLSIKGPKNYTLYLPAIEVPLWRNTDTVIRGDFLTKSGDGGFGLNPGFDGDIIIFPDSGI